MARIFISYKRRDKDVVFPLKDRIEAALGEPCWIDIDGIESDAQFMSVIIRAINEAEIFLFMYSHHHAEIEDYEQDWTVREINLAQKKGKRIVFVNIDKTPLSDFFEMWFGFKQQVDATSNESFDRLLSDMSKWMNITELEAKPASTKKPQSKPNNENSIEPIKESSSHKKPITVSKPLDSIEEEALDDQRIEEANSAYKAENYTAALSVYQDLAKKSNPRALYNCGLLYQNGLGVPKDTKKAFQYYAESAQYGNPNAYVALRSFTRKLRKDFYGEEVRNIDSLVSGMGWAGTEATMERRKQIRTAGATISKLAVESIGTWSIKAKADFELRQYKGKKVRVIYYVYPKDISEAEEKKLLGKTPGVRLPEGMFGYWEMTVPYHGVKWSKMPIERTYSYFKDLEKNKKKDYRLKVVVLDLEAKKSIASAEYDFSILHKKPFFGKESYIIETL